MAESFVTAHRWDLAWEDDLDVLTLGHGVQVKVLRHEPERGRLDLLVKFPPGYVEPSHPCSSRVGRRSGTPGRGERLCTMFDIQPVRGGGGR